MDLKKRFKSFLSPLLQKIQLKVLCLNSSLIAICFKDKDMHLRKLYKYNSDRLELNLFDV